MVKIVGPSGLVFDVEESVAAGLIDAGHVWPADQQKPTPAPVPAAPVVPAPETGTKEQPVPATDDEPGVERPAGNAAKPEWVEYALAMGVSEDKLTGMTRDQIREMFTGE